jgi:hypothetical protein
MIGDMDVAWSERLPRRRMIERFCAKQRENKRWVSFWELVELYARPIRSPEETKKSEDAAFRKLAIALCRGEFGRQVLYLTDRPGLPWRMTRDRFEAAVKIHPWKIVRSGWVELSWVPVGVAIAWCRSCQIAIPVGWVPGQVRESLPSRPMASERMKRSAGGSKRGAVPVYDRDKLKGRAFRLFKEHGGPPSVDGERGWRSRSDLERALADYCVEVIERDPPAKSTLQEIAKWCLEEWAKREGR